MGKTKRVPRFLVTLGVLGMFAMPLKAQTSGQGAGGTISQVSINISQSQDDDADDFSVAIQALIVLTLLSFGSAIVIMMTSFTRLVVVFFFLRMGLGTQSSPPNQVLIGLALFMTIFIMQPVFSTINTNAIQPYIDDEITQSEALDRASTPVKEF